MDAQSQLLHPLLVMQDSCVALKISNLDLKVEVYESFMKKAWC